jgi:hypothetical protein
MANEVTPQIPGLEALGNTPAPVALPGQATVQSGPDELLNSGNLPLAPSGGATIGQQLMAKQSPVLQKLAEHTDAAAKANPAAASAPGGWARTLLAGAMNAFSGKEAGGGPLQDLAAVGTVPSGGGALTGIARVQAARGQRLAEQRQEMSKEKTAELLRAETTQRIAANTRNTYRQELQDRTAAYNQNASFMSDLRKRYKTADDQDNVTQDQLNQMVKDKDFWRTHTGRPTGEEPVMEGGKPKLDQNGNPVMSPLYSISSTQGLEERTHPITEEESTFIKNNAGDNLPAGTELSVHQYDNAMVRAQAVRQAKQMIEKANDEDLSEVQARQLNTVMQDPRVQHYMAMVPGDPLDGLHTAQKNVQDHIAAIDQMIDSVQSKVPAQPGQVSPTVQALQQKRQQYVQEGQNVDKAISGFNEKAQDDYLKRQDERAKNAEIERHNKADEANKALELKVKNGGFSGDQNAATPEAYLNSLDPQAKALVQLIGTGKAPLNNPGYLLARKPEIMEAVSKAYPDFDISKVKSYQDTYKDYTEGKTSAQLKSGVTALKHLAEAQKMNTVTSHIPGTPDYNAYKNKIDTLATELASFYGDSTVPAIASIRDTLASTLPGNRQAAIRTQAESMRDRLDTLRDAWTAAAPSKEYEAQMPMGLAALTAQRNTIASITGQSPASSLTAPQGATATYKDAQGNVRGWAVNGKFVPAGQ